jgi:hypothetical protein
MERGWRSAPPLEFMSCIDLWHTPGAKARGLSRARLSLLRSSRRMRDCERASLTVRFGATSACILNSVKRASCPMVTVIVAPGL